MQGFLFIVALFFMVGTIVGAMEGPNAFRIVTQDSLKKVDLDLHAATSEGSQTVIQNFLTKKVDLNAAKNMLSSAWNGLRSSRVVGEGQSIAMVPTSEVNAGVKTTTMTMTKQVSHVALQASTTVAYFVIANYYCTGNLISNTVQTSYSACSSACQANSNCVAFGWIPSNLYCALKSSLIGTSCSYDSYWNMFINVAPQDTNYGVIQSFDCHNDANLISMTYTSLTDCETACTSRITCVGFVVANGQCYMKGTAVTDGSQSSCTGTSSQFPFYANLALSLSSGTTGGGTGSGSTTTSSVGFFMVSNYFCQNNILSNTVQSSVSACASACKQASNCVSFNWNPIQSSANNCILQSTLIGTSCSYNSAWNMYFNVAAQDTNYGVINNFNCIVNNNINAFGFTSSFTECETPCTTGGYVGFVVKGGLCYAISSSANDGSQSPCTGSNVPMYINLALLSSISSGSGGGTSGGNSPTNAPISNVQTGGSPTYSPIANVQTGITCTTSTDFVCGSGSTGTCCPSGTTCVLPANNYNTVSACLLPGQTACGGYAYSASTYYGTCSYGNVCLHPVTSVAEAAICKLGSGCCGSATSPTYAPTTSSIQAVTASLSSNGASVTNALASAFPVTPLETCAIHEPTHCCNTPSHLHELPHICPSPHCSSLCIYLSINLSGYFCFQPLRRVGRGYSDSCYPEHSYGCDSGTSSTSRGGVSR